MITIIELSKMVENMRMLQKQYFGRRDTEILQKAKEAEKQVDRAIININHEVENPPGLFDDDYDVRL